MMSNQQKTIAVVDDDPEMRCAMRNLLSALGYVCKTYDTAKTFLNCASTCEAICLVLDIQLGDISGIELAYRLAADGFRFPIIFMTGLDDATIRKQAVAAGGIAFLRKPFSAETLADAITKAVDIGAMAKTNHNSDTLSIVQTGTGLSSSSKPSRPWSRSFCSAS
jgi:FixJ family two-component response regulator